MSTPEPETSEPAEPATEEGAGEAAKRRFREALDAKKARQGEDHLDGGRTGGHAHGPVEAKRTFRRKTG